MSIERKTLRCAIYTRVSTEHGLEQEFSSLDAQREASEAYVKSQTHEGWKLLPALYDDGGFSGGSMQRPALQRLLHDIAQGRIDIVVVYKVDRLTRSLADFAKLVELFDTRGVSFVSVTQAFNTTTSMGRLTLNVLLSFAQFEREVSGERIRDKIAASKRKGIRMGGPAPLGYDVKEKKLVINRREAEIVRLIFKRYLQVGSLNDLVVDLKKKRVLSKKVRQAGGSFRGGIPFEKGALAYLLRNRTYMGDTVHKDKHYPGEHPAIIDQKQFDAVQKAIASRAQSRGAKRLHHKFLLAGLLFDEHGRSMAPSTTKKGQLRYRYYASAAMKNENVKADPTRVAASEIEFAVLKAAKAHISKAHTDDQQLVKEHIRRVGLKPRSMAIEFCKSDGRPGKSVSVPWARPSFTKKRELLIVSEKLHQRPIRAESRARLIDSIARARVWVDDLVAGRVTDTRQIASHVGSSERSVRMTLSLAFLSPKIVCAAIAGALPYGSGITHLTNMPADWDTQMQQLTFLKKRTQRM